MRAPAPSVRMPSAAADRDRVCGVITPIPGTSGNDSRGCDGCSPGANCPTLRDPRCETTCRPAAIFSGRLPSPEAHSASASPLQEPPRACRRRDWADRRPVGALLRPSTSSFSAAGFTGPEQVEYATARGHTVTLLNRNRTRPDFFQGRAEQLVGDLNDDVSALKGRKFDVVIDNPTTMPAWVRNAAQHLHLHLDPLGLPGQQPAGHRRERGNHSHAG